MAAPDELRASSGSQSSGTPGAHAVCSLCGGTDLRPLYDGVRDRLGVAPGTWSFCRCASCRSALLHPCPRPEELKDFYPDVYTFYPEVSSSSSLKSVWSRLEYYAFYVPQYVRQTRILRAFLRAHVRPHASILDVGCGRGLRMVALKQAGFEVAGIDFDAGSVRYVQDTLGIPAFVGDIHDIAHHFPDAAFDALTAFYVLEHVTDLVGTLATLRQAVRPSGWIIAAVPLTDSVQAQLCGMRWSQITEAPRHTLNPSQLGMRRAFERAGFARVEIRADATLSCAAVLSLSLTPRATTSHLYAARSWRTLANRIAGGLLSLLLVPACFVESHVLRRPALGIVFAQRREEPATP